MESSIELSVTRISSAVSGSRGESDRHQWSPGRAPEIRDMRRDMASCREVTASPCQQSVTNPVENPVMPAFESNDIESTGSC